MSNDIVIRADGLSKKYVIGHEAQRERYVALRDVIARGVLSAMRKAADMARGRIVVPGDEVEEFWALKNVNFEVKRGEVLGIIGRNGAGKSTLLKILSRITEPTEGRVTIKGRVASLLEVGTGFHPELTGRENIYLNGAILGMKRTEIKRKFDDIVAFAEVEKFLDTPVKRYSSGMYVRLAFAVAAHLEPEILIVDEVLAVGDAEFQKKCLGKMQDVAGHGRTVLFVSHQLSAVQRLCTHGLLLQGGQLVCSGDISAVAERYLMDSRVADNGRRVIEVEDGTCRFMSWHLGTSEDSVSHTCFSRDTVKICVRLEAKRRVPSAQISVVIRNVMGDLLIALNSQDGQQEPIDIVPGACEIQVTMRMPLKEGRYQLDFALADESWSLIDQWIAQPLLTVFSRHETVLPPEWRGMVNEPASIEVLRCFETC